MSIPSFSGTASHTTVSIPHGGSSKRGSHRLAAALTCGRLWAFTTKAKMRLKKEPEARLMGTLFHTCMAFHYGPKCRIRPPFIDHKTLEQALMEDSNGDKEHIEQAMQMYGYYRTKYAGEAWQPIAVEHEVYAKIRDIDPAQNGRPSDEEEVSARLDMAVLYNGEVWLVDYKTSSGRGKERLARWDPDEYRAHWQCMLNLLICRTPEMVEHLGGYPKGYIIVRGKQSDPFDFDRNEVEVSPVAYADAPTMARDAVEREMGLESIYARGEYSKLAPNFAACRGREWPCDFRELCHARSANQQELVRQLMFKQGV